ncbi:hypothetical protein ABZW02_24555 [Streptomyces sp. NPDC005180]|uniref:hypothetical protein n=1 Tax=Streptomyces sp. NPDC005180 TaxID=3156868 RepID=UPI0033A67BF2
MSILRKLFRWPRPPAPPAPPPVVLPAECGADDDWMGGSWMWEPGDLDDEGADR